MRTIVVLLALSIAGCVSEGDKRGERSARQALAYVISHQGMSLGACPPKLMLAAAQRNSDCLRAAGRSVDATLACMKAERQELDRNAGCADQNKSADEVAAMEKAYTAACVKCASADRCEGELRRIRRVGLTAGSETACP